MFDYLVVCGSKIGSLILFLKRVRRFCDIFYFYEVPLARIGSFESNESIDELEKRILEYNCRFIDAPSYGTCSSLCIENNTSCFKKHLSELLSDDWIATIKRSS